MDHGNLTPEIAKGLKVLRERIKKANLPTSELDQTLNLATWNIREFGKKDRDPRAIHYIAEILGQFDLISIVELRGALGDLSRVMQILGPYWKVLYSDYIDDPGGNDERMCFLYDSRSVRFTGLAAEADPERKKDKTTGQYVAPFTWWRSPYIASFRAGHFDFVLITVHIRWGDSEDERIVELTGLADWIQSRIKDKQWDDKDIIVVGDFNIPDRNSKLYKAVTAYGLQSPDALLKKDHGSDLEKVRAYDQILHLPRFTNCFTDKGDVLDFYCGDHTPLFPDLTKDKFTYQLSDHLPLWIQVQVDTLDEQIDQVIKGSV